MTIVCIVPYIVASAPSNLMFEVRSDGTSVLLTWTPPSPLGDTTGYRIHYTGGSSGSQPVSGGSTNSYTLTGLRREESYDISIVGTSEHLSSERVQWKNVTISPGKNNMLLSSLVLVGNNCFVFSKSRN